MSALYCFQRASAGLSEGLGRASIAGRLGEREGGHSAYQSVQLTPMTTSIDLEAYFQRIGYEGGRTPTLETLRAIQLRHAETIAFESIFPVSTSWPAGPYIESLQQKPVRDGRGGYCFEQNPSFSHVLKALGFQVTGLAARVL